MKIQKLNLDASSEDVIKKINEIIDRINDMRQDVYIGPMPSAYNLNAVSKLIKKQK